MFKRLAVVAAGLVLGASPMAWAGDQPEVGEEAGSFMLKAINTEILGSSSANIRLDDFVGPEAKTPKKAVLLSFFASWCEPCKREMPFLQILHDAYQAKGLQILSITIDKEPEKMQIAHELAIKNGLKFPVLSDHFGILARRYSISKLPCVYLVSSTGKLAWINVGYGDDASKNMHEEVRKALGLSVSDAAPQPVMAYLLSHQSGGHAESVEVPGAEAKADPNKTVPPAALGGGSTAVPTPAGDTASADATDMGKSKGGKGKKAKAKNKKARKALADD